MGLGDERERGRGREGGRERGGERGRKAREREREEGRERAGGTEREEEGGRKGEREGDREGERENCHRNIHDFNTLAIIRLVLQLEALSSIYILLVGNFQFANIVTYLQNSYADIFTAAFKTKML